jgi:hypothetical protein
MCTRLYQVSKVGNITEVIRFIPYCALAKIGKRLQLRAISAIQPVKIGFENAPADCFLFLAKPDTMGHTFVLIRALSLADLPVPSCPPRGLPYTPPTNS